MNKIKLLRIEPRYGRVT